MGPRRTPERPAPALAGLPRYIATVETAKHRVFQFLDAATLPDNMLIAIGVDDAAALARSVVTLPYCLGATAGASRLWKRSPL
ncbi:MAG: hypothetical protein R3D60_13195 [Paracoccaceae bacterium]